MSRNILKSSVQNASFSIIFQIIFRIITFILNAFVIRHVGHDVLGIMNVRLLLLESTILFLSKEPLLKACLTNTKSHNWAQIVNQIWISVPVCGLLSISLVYVWINWLSPIETQYLNQYRLGCYSMAVSCVIDQISQNFVLVAQSYCFVKLKVVLDTIHIISRTIIFVTIIIYKPHQAINAFSIAQIISCLLHFLGYAVFFWWYINKLNQLKSSGTRELPKTFRDMHDFQFNSIVEFLPGFMENKEPIVNKNLCILTASFVKQCVVKQILTEGERYVMTVSPVLTLSEQATYDVVNNLGSLAARFIFRPIEESSYFYFSQALKRGTSAKEQDDASVNEATSVLSQLCTLVTSIGLLVTVFGQMYSGTLLYLYGGRALTTELLPETLLKCHCVAVLLLAVNGVTECYVFATMSSKQLDRYNHLMVILSVSFLAISYILTNIFGPVGFILANCANMSARILHSIYFIHFTYKGTKYRPLNGLRPRNLFLGALFLSAVVTRFSQVHLYKKSLFLHLVVGAVCFLCTLALWLYQNRNLMQDTIRQYKRRASVKVN